MPNPGLQESNASPEDLGNLGLDDVIITGYNPCPSSLSSFANDPNSGLIDKQVISGKGVTKHGMPTGTKMVDISDAELEREIHHFSRPRCDFDK